MKNKFLSKAVPRGARTIWRYLGALFLLFTFAIGNVWGTSYIPGDRKVVTADETIDYATIAGANATTSGKWIVNPRGGTTSSKKYTNLTTDTNGNPDGIVDNIATITSNVNMATIQVPSTAKYNQNGKYVIHMRITGITGIIAHGVTGSTGRGCAIYGQEYSTSLTENTEYGSALASMTRGSNSGSFLLQYTGFTASKEYLITIAATGGDDQLYAIELIAGSVTKHTVTYKLNGATGTTPTQADVAEGAKFTLHNGTTGITAPTNKDFDGWHDGTTKYAGGAEYTMGTSDVELTAQWIDHVAKYTLVYRVDGVAVGNEQVNVIGTPVGIADPTKDCYTFAGWSPALDAVSGTDGATVYVDATWTPKYANTVDLTAAAVKDANPRPNVNTYLTGFNYVSSITFDISKYEYTSNVTKPGYYGYKVNTANDKLKFLVQQGKQVKVLFGSLKNVPTIKVNNVSKSLDADRTEGDMAENTFTYTASAEDALVEITFGSGTSTLKTITISSLYNATYTDEKGDASGSASNVTEVTLPTPSATTVGGYSFIGWIANKTVYKGETAKTAGEGLDAGETYTLTANTAFTAQWQLISDFDVKFFHGYGDPDAQIGTTQSISTGNYATAPEDPVRAGFVFLGWSYDGTEANIVDVATYGITAETNFRAMWKAVWTVTFDGAGNVNVEDGETVASPDSPTQAGKVFQGWYNGESKYDFSAAVTGNLALESKWAAADPNHFYYTYNDDFHFDGVVYKTPEGAVDGGSGTSNIAMTTPYTLFAGAEGITSIVMTDGIYDSKTGAIQAVTALMKVNNNATSKLTVTIKSGYTATLKIKSSGYSATRTINVSDATPASGTTTGQAVTSGAMSVSGIGELSFALNSGSHDLTVTGGTLYIAELDIEATALPTHSVTYKPGYGGSELWVVDADATEVRDGSTMFTAPTGTVFNGWKDELDNDVEVGAIVSADMALTAQWINVYAVTFNFNGQSGSIAPQSVKNGEKATKPADPVVMGQEFGGWYTDVACSDGNEFDFNTLITEPKELFAKWTAFDGCVELYPALSGDALIVGAMVDLQAGSVGGSIKVANLGAEGSIAYNANGLSFSNGGKDSVLVTLNNDLKNGSIIKVRLMANGGTKDSGRGLNLYNAASVKKALLGWQANEEVTSGDIREFTYTVVESDGFAGTNVFTLQRQNSVFLQSIKVEECGDAIVYHNLTSEVNIAGKGTVTLGASSVREGYTTTATYSEIDPLYEFVNWTVSGAGASVADATANPATITVGTEDAVVTLNLQLIPVKFTVEYYDGATLMGSEQVAVNENPTASEIVTAKRHYTFLGWSETDGGDVVALNTITRTEAGTVMLYAKYEAVACPTNGTIFSMEFDETKKPGETVTIAKDASIDLAEYATISGGNAMIINGETSGKDAISTDGEFLLKATKEVMKIELNCVLQEGDIIRIPDNSAKLVISTSNAKTGTYQAFADKNTHEFAVTAAWAGVDDIYVLYDGSSLKFTKVYVIRPAKFDVSFNMMGHGTQIADIEDVLEGSKITAPTAPTDADYSFAGWYKENTFANEWKFDVDVVTANTTLYAKWLDKSDATLKSLKYGAEEITLQAGVYTYNVTLPAFTSAVPALTAETSNPNATKVISNAAAFDSEGNATSTVTVTPEVGADQVYTVNFAKGVLIPLQEVTGSITWNFANAVTANVSITGTPQVLANYAGVTNDNTFESDKLEASGEKFSAGTKANLRANYIHFHTTVPGMLTISYSNTGGNPARYIYVNGAKYDEDGSANTTPKGADNKVFVPAGDVELVMKDGEDASKNVQIYQMIFNATPDYTRPVTEGRYGTICLPNGGVMVGAELFEIAYYGETSHKIFLDNIPSGEMEAGRPYIFLPKEGTTQLAVFYTDEVNASAGSHNGLIGFIGDAADAYFYIPDGEGNYILQNNLYREVLIGGQARILSNRAYIKLSAINPTEPALAPGRRRVALGVQSEQVATGCENLNVSDKPVKMIIDGQLFILRGEKMYDAKGQLVK